MIFSTLYGTNLDRELGTLDRTVRFTTVLRKSWVNEGQQKFNEQVSCFVKRDSIALVDGDGEYDVEVETADYMWPAKVGASIERTLIADSSVTYIEGDDFKFISEEELNVQCPGWRSHSPGTPRFWGFRPDTGSLNIILYPSPDIPATETWALKWPYVARPEDMTADSDEPYGNATPRTTLRPYHDALVHYAAAQGEKLRKNVEGVDRQMKQFAAYVAKYGADQAPPRGTTMRVAVNPFARMSGRRPMDPTRWP